MSLDGQDSSLKAEGEVAQQKSKRAPVILLYVTTVTLSPSGVSQCIPRAFAGFVTILFICDDLGIKMMRA